MSPQELIRLLEGIIVIGGAGAIIFAVFKNSTVKQTIASQKEFIETLTGQVNELRTLHMSNKEEIAELRGQVSVYKELPLKELAHSMKKISETQEKILTQLKKNTVHQTVTEQSVGKQVVKE
jgi:hypothetical protein